MIWTHFVQTDYFQLDNTHICGYFDCNGCLLSNEWLDRRLLLLLLHLWVFMGYNIWSVFNIFYNGVSLHLSLSQGQTITLANHPKGNSLWYIINLTTISVEPKILTESGLLKLKTCSLYHENLLLQKFNGIYVLGSIHI